MLQNERDALKVRNKDIRTLARVLTAMRDVTNVEEMRDWMRERMYNITQHLSGMPSGGSGGKGMDDTFARLSELEEEHREKCKRYMEELEKAEAILNVIASPTMRTFVTMRYVLDIPGAEIMKQLNLSEWKYKQAKQRIEGAKNMASVQWKEPEFLGDS